jgi:hypothetical protein
VQELRQLSLAQDIVRAESKQSSSFALQPALLSHVLACIASAKHDKMSALL